MSPGYARRCFPSFDEPELKASFEISVAKTDRVIAVSNMPVKSNEEM
jgi:aminopeptidase N